MDYNLLYNILYEEIIYLQKQQQFFIKHFDDNINYILSEYIDSKIKIYNFYMNKL
jgi:hypothetical protein